MKKKIVFSKMFDNNPLKIPFFVVWVTATAKITGGNSR